jgi:predicted metal-dependent peptidase
MLDEKLRECIVKLMFSKDNSFWGYIFSRVARVPDSNLPTVMGVTTVDCESFQLMYNPELLRDAEDNQIMVVLQHEGVHLLNMHLPRLLRIFGKETNLAKEKQNIASDWNIACDISANELIGLEQPFKFGHCEIRPLTASMFGLPEGKTAEWYYEYIRKNGKKVSAVMSSSGSASRLDDHSGWWKCTEKVPDVLAASRKLESFSKQLIAEAANECRGNLPMGIKEIIDELLSVGELQYYELIRKLVKGSLLTKWQKCLTRINRKRVYTFVTSKEDFIPEIPPFPGRKRDFSYYIGLLLDTSGSMSASDIRRGLSSIRDILENDRSCKITVIEVDAQVQKVYDVKKIADIQYDVRGRGGTYLSPALWKFKELGVDVVLAFTDGYCEDLSNTPRSVLPKKIIWIITSNGSCREISNTGFILRLPDK